ncbi:hypothetical protein LPB136_09245 [Tenacibaculum todarodis]|uniref:Thiol-activated cytolysin n=1 Tax=Tenacibaculum todarodis TaxID=1850252 RepID=A0A1L3JKA5_9FLAO|nr:thiol-activated cytolysin family protein [Tenacibaculum todarodis]APG65532.1 hypothetical protein LPB136_09245 [Tenacibaculum todarodis]
MKNLLSVILILFLAIGANAQIKKVNTKKKPLKIKVNKDKKLQLIKLKKSNLVFLKEFKVKDNFTSNSDTYGERRIKIISTDYEDKVKTKVTDVGSKEIEEGFECVNQSITIDANSSSFKEFTTQGIADWIKPGVLLNVVDYLDFNRKAITLPRQPINISTNLSKSGSSIQTIENPEKNSEMQEAVNKLKRNGNVASNFTFDYSEVHNIDQLSFDVFGEYRNNLLGLETSVGFSSDKRKERHYYKVELFQNMFSISVDALNAEQLFEEKPTNINMKDLMYVSKVNYGRRVIIILESKFKLSSKEVELESQINRLLQGGEMSYGFERLKVNQNLNIKAFFYGGTTGDDFRALGNLIESGTLNVNETLKSYFNSLQSNSEEALPISYELRNLNNDRLGMESAFTQNIRTCTPKLTENLKLKVTLTGIQNIHTRDSKTKADKYGLQQYIDFKLKRGEITDLTMNKQSIKERAEYRRFSNRIGVKNEDGKIHVNQVINGSKNNIISVQENKVDNPSNINNSLTFTITPSLFKEDVNSQFRVYSWLKEYTHRKRGAKKDVNPTVLVNWEYIDVDLKVVIQYLLNPNSGMIFDKAYHDKRLIDDGGYMYSGAENVIMPLKKANDATSLIGPIRLNKSGTNATAIAWYRFELVD